MTEVEYAGIVLEDQLLDHLATPEGAMMIWRERLSPEVINESDDGIREALEFVVGYIEQYGEAPTVSIIAEETGYEDFNEPEVPIEYLLDKLNERFKKQEVQKAVKKVARLSNVAPHEALTLGFSEFSRIMGETASQRSTFDTHNMGLVLDRYKHRQETSTEGLSWGFPEMDKLLQGLRKGELYFVVARPKRFKSWMLVKSALECFYNGHDVTLFSLEMTAEEIQDRIFCMITGVSYTQFQHRSLMPRDLQVLEDAKHWLMEQPMKLRVIRPPMGERTIGHMKQIAKEHGAQAVFIDQLSWIESTRKASIDQRWREVAFICEDAKEAAMDFPVYIAAQFNREAQGAKSVFDLDLANIGLSDAIGQTADTLLGIYSSKEMKASGIMQYGVIDSRAFDQSAWEVKIELGLNTNFRVIEEIDPDDVKDE